MSIKCKVCGRYPEAEPHVCEPAQPLDPKARELLERAYASIYLMQQDLSLVNDIADYLKGKQ